MPRYRMLKVAAGPDGVWNVGTEHTLSRAIGDALVGDQAAVCLDAADIIDVSLDVSVPETATRSAPETAQGRGARVGKARRTPRETSDAGDDV